MYSLLFLTICFLFYVSANASGSVNAPAKNFLAIVTFNDCEGKNAANYTAISEYQLDQACDSNSLTSIYNGLIQCNGDQRAINSLQTLAASLYPAGAYYQYEVLYLVTGGPLQGKYIYGKVIALYDDYLKKCSSILGYSYTTSKSAVILISDKLDLNVLLSTTGAFDVFKKGANTACTGTQYVI